MIIYHKTKQEFLRDARSNALDDIVLQHMREQLKHGTSKAQQAAWKHSLQAMALLLSDPDIPADCGICIEYKLPLTGKLIDFMITGQDAQGVEHVIIVELKQWTESEATGKDAVVKTFLNKGIRETSHPSYQAATYAFLLEDFNQTIQEQNIQLHACAYLHNHADDGVLTGACYVEHVALAPIFFKTDSEKFLDFIKQYIQKGDLANVVKRIDEGKLRPSKSLADSVASMLGGNQEFRMVDDQKIVYEVAMELFCSATAESKHVLIVEGGPGTGKSVVAVNLLVELIHQHKVAQYVTKNAAPRDVFSTRLAGSMRKGRINRLFVGSGGFANTQPNTFDALIVDEGHRLNEKSGLYGNLGENQIKELISTAKLTVFFVDEKQRVTLRDIGTRESIEKWAAVEGAQVHRARLKSQFRCNGSDEYLGWLDQTLQLAAAGEQEPGQEMDYAFQVVSSPNELRDIIVEKNKERNKARMVAGYCWRWPSKKNPEAMDVVIKDHDFAIQWNLTVDGGRWIMNPDSVQQIGCIHTCQGLEVDYVGIIVGPDLVVRNGKIKTDATKRASSDTSVRGHKKLSKEKPVETAAILESIIKNTYRTLMTRGMKGCYVYFTDAETEKYFRKQLEKAVALN